MVRSLISNFGFFAIVFAMGPVGLVACSAPPGEGGSSAGGQSTSVQDSTGGSNSTGGSGMAAGGSTTTGGSGTAAGGHATGGAVAVGGASKGGTTAAAAPTWSQLYSNYFGPNTAGDCVSCHGSGVSPTFTSASSMCSAMKSYGVIGNGTAHFETVLKWFNQNGIMPQNNNPTPANAVADITAWENAGAVCP